jgi:hypothetical protein
MKYNRTLYLLSFFILHPFRIAQYLLYINATFCGIYLFVSPAHCYIGFILRTNAVSLISNTVRYYLYAYLYCMQQV